MGIRGPRTLFDLYRLKANLKLTCRQCGRSGVYLTRDVEAYFRSKNWNTSWEMLGCRFVCRGMAPGEGCGAKDVEVGLSPVPLPPVFPKPEPTEWDLRKEAERRR